MELAVWDTPQRPVVDVSERFVCRDGHYDPRERGFALFAVDERLDVDTAVSVAEVIPLMTRRFAHIGEVDYATRFARHHYAKDLDTATD